MDSTPQSTPGPTAEFDRLDQPLPPLPPSEFDITVERDLAATDDLLRTEAPPTEASSSVIYGSSPRLGHEGAQQHQRQSSSVRDRSQSSSSLSIQRSRSASRPEFLMQSHASGSNEDLYLAGDSNLLSRTSSIHGSGAARSLRLGDHTGESTPRSRSQSQTLLQALQLPQPLTSRTSPSGSDSDDSYRDSPLLSHTSPNQIRQRQGRDPDTEPVRSEFGVPRWQPDAEVTMCPICRTQFSFFVRKHHCRKCGRVVCSACSPHRITIPYQYIVQPPMEGASPTTGSQVRPPMDSRNSSLYPAGSLGGGERVRLCNPCVPDPNTAPPQSPVPHLRQSSQRGHSRAASTATSTYSSSDNYRSREEIERLITNFPRRQRESSLIGGRPLPQTGSRGVISTNRDDRGLRQDLSESRSRSSTVGSSRDTNGMGQYPGGTNTFSARTSQGTTQQPYRPLVPRMDENNSRVLSSRPRHPERRRIPEEDECWICHLELPSRTLDNFEKLREDHVESCLAAVMGGSSLPIPTAVIPALPRASPVRAESSNSTLQTQSTSSTAISVPVANTPEARMAAREQAHAAVVFGHSQPSSPGPSRRTGVFPYQATEKDCVDDAECTICLEEFIPGVEMGRLECFCRFHLLCIRQWFEKHPGQCPVHQHGAGY